MTQQIRLGQEGFVRTAGYQLVQWTAINNTTDPLESLFVIRRTSLGESFERVANLGDFVTYPVNELKFFEGRGTNANALFSAVPGDQVVFDPEIEYWLQSAAPYNDCVFTVAAVVPVSGSAPKLKVGNFLQLDDYTFTEDDTDRWFSLSGFASSGYNQPARVVSVLTGHTAIVAFDAGTTVVTNETGTSWTKRRLRIETGTIGMQEPRFFPTVVRNAAWKLKRGGSTIAYGPNGETSRTDPTLTLFRDRRVTTIHSSLDAALALTDNTKAAVALLQAAAEQNNTSFLGVHTTDFP